MISGLHGRDVGGSSSDQDIPDPSSCSKKPRSQSSWPYIGPQTQPFPDPRSEAPSLSTDDAQNASLSTISEVTAAVMAKRAAPGEGFTAVNSTRPIPGKGGLCEQTAQIRLDQSRMGRTGWIKTKPAMMDNETWQYCLFWELDRPITMYSFLKTPAMAFFVKSTLVETTGPSSGQRCWQGIPGQQIILEAGISPEGMKGEISLFGFIFPPGLPG